MSGDDDIRFSRSGNTNALGKCTEDVKTKVPEITKEELITLATLQGIPLAEYVRNVLTEHSIGRIHMLRLNNSIPFPRDTKGQQ